MTKLLRFLLFSILCLASTGVLHAQSTLIHYWNFNNLAGPYTHPNIPKILPDFTLLSPDSAAYLEYYLLPGTSATWAISGNDANNASGAQIDNVTGDTTNARQGAPAGTGIRFRNPTDSAEIRWHIPSTGFSNLVVKFATQTSSIASGDSSQDYSYSVDGGKTWDSTGMTVNGAAGHTLDVTQGGNANSIYLNFAPVTVTFGNDQTVNNNPNLIFRIIFHGNTHPGYPVSGSAQVSGNNRFDNFTLDGTGASSAPPGSITVITPIGEALLEAGRKVPITFSTFSTVGAMRTIQFSPDAGTTWQTVGTVTGTSYLWTIPNTPTTKGMIRVMDSASVTGTNPGGTFTIISIPNSNIVVHYWNFNTIKGQFNNPNIPEFPSDFSGNLNYIGSIQYVNNGSKSYAGYIDGVAGDTVNALFGSVPGVGLRVRNPTDSMELRLIIPTAGFKGISIHYALQTSDSTLTGAAPHTENFDYSTDGGTTWSTAGLSVNGVASTSLNVHQPQYGSTLTGVGAFGPVSIGFGTQTSMDDNPNFVFRIKFADSTHGTSGNNRFDNISVDASAPAGVDRIVPELACQVVPSITQDQILITSPEGRKNITITDDLGRTLANFSESDRQYNYNVSNLATGTYFIHIHAANGAEATLRFVKE